MHATQRVCPLRHSGMLSRGTDAYPGAYGEDPTAPSPPMASVRGVPAARSVTVRGRRPSRSHRLGMRTTPQSGLAQCSRVWRSSRRTRLSRGHDRTEDAARAAPARPPAPQCLLRPCRTAPCRPTATDLLRACSRTTRPPEPSPQAGQASRPSRVSSVPDAARHSLAGTCCPAVQEHHSTSVHTAFSPRCSRIRGGT